ncbi:MAG: hypothetical protein LBL83_02830, partial [Clostridiales bacterium]|nr:hypothetical protein [Clostridiales bacterium]
MHYFAQNEGGTVTQKKTVRLARRARKAPKAQNSWGRRIWSAFGAMRARIWQGLRRGRRGRDRQQLQNSWDRQDGHPQDGRGGEGLPDLRDQQQEQGACAELPEHCAHFGPQELDAHGGPPEPGARAWQHEPDARGGPRKPSRRRKPRARRSYLLRLIVSCAALLLLPFAAGSPAGDSRAGNARRDAVLGGAAGGARVSRAVW